MHDARFFQSTRGKIVAALRRRRSATALELAGDFGLSTNAIRQHLVVLERDGFVEEKSVRRGPTKPTFEYSLTPDADTLFPQHYDKMLNAVLKTVREKLGDGALATVLTDLGDRAGERFNRKVGDKQGRERLEAIAELLREQGVDADVLETEVGFELREHNCPYAQTVGEHPEMCSVIHTALGKSVPGTVKHIESLATGGDACRFEVVLLGKANSTAAESPLGGPSGGTPPRS
jgi:predicted ArsR family transcriptional regulator